ncbi:MAG: ABC transporter permease, partial [Acidobacteriota bacterium]
MDWLMAALRRLAAALRRERAGADLEEEMRFHLEMKAEANRAAGMSDEEARRAARLAFGNPALALEDSRAAWRFVLLDRLLQDVRYAARGLVRSPVFGVAVVLTLALGIGVNTTMFTLIDAVMLRTLPVEDPSELYVFGSRLSSGTMVADRPGERHPVLYSYPLYLDLRDRTTVFTDLAAISSFAVRAYESTRDVASGGSIDVTETRLVTGNFFSLLGVGAVHGRVLEPSDDGAPGARPVAVLSHGYWLRRFGGDPEAIGRTLRLNGTEYSIIGVATLGFDGVTAGEATDVWIPMAMQSELMRDASRLNARGTMWLRAIGRLAPGVSPERAQARSDQLLHQLVLAEVGDDVTPEIEGAVSRLSTELVSFAGGFGVLRSTYSQRLLILMGMVGLVLLIACANVGNLLLARASARYKEISMRLALGSGRGRLLQQMLTESVLIASLGGVLGLLLARWGAALSLVLISSRPSALPLELRFDARVVGFTIVLTALTATAFGLAPAWRSSHVDFNASLREQGSGPSRRQGRWGLRETLVVFQVAISLLLLIGAGLFVRSLDNLRHEEIGFSPQGVLVVDIDPRGGGYAEEQLTGLYDEVVERLEAIPGVQSASFSYYSPFSGTSWRADAAVEGFEPQAADDLTVGLNEITPEHLETVGIPLLEGRTLSRADREGTPRVAIVSQAFARHFFGPESAVGKSFGLDGAGSEHDIEIVGVFGDIKHQDVREETMRFVYQPVAQVPDYLESIEVRTRGDARALAPLVRAAIGEVARRLPVLDVHTLSDQVDRTLHRDRLFSRLSALFGGLALLLASIGLYGVLAYAVARRTAEIGVRMALGAGKREVVWMILGDGLRLLAVGVLLGLPAALAAGRAASSLLYGLR